MFKKLIALLVPVSLILNIQPVSSATSPERKLIADAIKLYNSVTPEDSTIVRLTKRENFLKTIDQIIMEVFDINNNINIAIGILKKNKFRKIKVEEEKGFEESNLVNIIASKT